MGSAALKKPEMVENANRQVKQVAVTSSHQSAPALTEPETEVKKIQRQKSHSLRSLQEGLECTTEEVSPLSGQDFSLHKTLSKSPARLKTDNSVKACGCSGQHTCGSSSSSSKSGAGRMMSQPQQLSAKRAQLLADSASL